MASIRRRLLHIGETMANPETDLLVDLDQRVLTLTLNRPSKRNALSESMIVDRDRSAADGRCRIPRSVRWW